MFREPSELRDVHGISEMEKTLIKAFMQGAVYSWIKNCEAQAFAVRDLMGGENTEWEGTPLYVLYLKHIAIGKDDAEAIISAGRDLGWLTKTVLFEDKRTFVIDKVGGPTGEVSSYQWIGHEP
jgi:hypothetical protein